MDEIEIRFTETEVAQILWVLSEAADRDAAAHLESLFLSGMDVGPRASSES